MNSRVFVVLMSVLIWTVTTAIEAEDPNEEWRTELHAFLGNAARVLEVPGAAVVVVSKDRPPAVLTCGVQCNGAGRPVSSSTSFGIGSLSKAFTATAAAALVGEGTIQWDTRIQESVPDLDLGDPMANERLTLRDLLAHRSGLANHNLVHFNIDAGTAWLVPRLELLEPAGEFRDRFVYSSLGYILAGDVVGRAAGSSWSDVVSRRLLEPLGMVSTTVGPPSSSGLPTACGYLWRGDALVAIDPVHLSVAAPAMGLYSNGDDFARWLEFLLGEGEFRGRRVVEVQALRETWTPQTALRRQGSKLRAHGLGWYLSSWRGRRLVHHDGGGYGFTSTARIYPDAGIGIAVFANRAVSALPDVVAERAAELIFGESMNGDMLERAAAMSKRIEALHSAAAEALLSTIDESAPPSLELQAYTGCYEHPVFGRLEFRVDEGSLVASFHDVGHGVQHLHHETFMLSSPYTGDNRATFARVVDRVSSVSLSLGSPPHERVFARIADGCSDPQPGPGRDPSTMAATLAR